MSSCIGALARGTTIDYVQKKCPIECIETKDLLVTTTNKRNFVITNGQGHDIVVSCNGTVFPILNAPGIGALEVQVPCHCDLRIDRKRRDKNSFPCTSEFQDVQINHTIPMYFTHQFQEVLVKIEQPIYIAPTKNLSTIVTEEDSVITIINPMDIDPKEDDDFEPTFPGWVENQWNWPGTLEWICIGTLGVVCLLLWIRTRNNSLVPLSIAMNSLLTRVEARRPSKDTFCYLPPHVETLLWINVAVTTFALTPLLMIFLLRKFQEKRRELAIRRLIPHAPNLNTIEENRRMDTLRIEDELRNLQVHPARSEGLCEGLKPQSLYAPRPKPGAPPATLQL